MTKKRRVVHTIKAKQAKCAECGGFPDLGLHNSKGEILMYCLSCAKKLSAKYPWFKAVVADFEADKAPSN